MSLSHFLEKTSRPGPGDDRVNRHLGLRGTESSTGGAETVPSHEAICELEMGDILHSLSH